MFVIRAALVAHVNRFRQLIATIRNAGKQTQKESAFVVVLMLCLALKLSLNAAFLFNDVQLIKQPEINNHNNKLDFVFIILTF